MSNETKKAAGRPSAFPGQETAQVTMHLPKDSRKMLKRLALDTEASPAVIIDRLIREAFAEANEQA